MISSSSFRCWWKRQRSKDSCMRSRSIDSSIARHVTRDRAARDHSRARRAGTEGGLERSLERDRELLAEDVDCPDDGRITPRVDVHEPVARPETDDVLRGHAAHEPVHARRYRYRARRWINRERLAELVDAGLLRFR